MEATEEDKRKFQSILKGRNFITPTVLTFLRIDSFIIEISEGDFMDKKLFGFTVVEESHGKLFRRMDLDECVHSMEELERKKNELKDYYVKFLEKYGVQ